MRRHTRPALVASALSRSLTGLPGRGRDLKLGYRLQLAWPRIVGELMARYLFPVDVSGDRLTIGVTSAVFMQEAEYQRDSLLSNISKEVGEGTIRQLSFRMLPKAPKAAPPPPKKSVTTDAPRPLSDEQAAHLEEELKRIADPALREQMRRVLSRALERHDER
jgi:hypothetical protein